MYLYKVIGCVYTVCISCHNVINFWLLKFKMIKTILRFHLRAKSHRTLQFPTTMLHTINFYTALNMMITMFLFTNDVLTNTRCP